MMSKKNTLSENISLLRKGFNLSQKKFAEIIGVIDKTVSGYETGRVTPSAKIIARISKAFEVPVDFLLNEKLRLSELNKDEEMPPYMLYDYSKETKGNILKGYTGNKEFYEIFSDSTDREILAACSIIVRLYKHISKEKSLDEFEIIKLGSTQSLDYQKFKIEVLIKNTPLHSLKGTTSQLQEFALQLIFEIGEILTSQYETG